MPKQATTSKKNLRQQEGPGSSHIQVRGTPRQQRRSVREQVDEYLHFGTEMDENISSAKLGLTREEAEAVREMRPDILEMAQGEQEKKDNRASSRSRH